MKLDREDGRHAWQVPLARGRHVADVLVISLIAGGLLGGIAWFVWDHGYLLDEIADARMLAGAAFLMIGMALLLAAAVVLAFNVLETARVFLSVRLSTAPTIVTAGLAYMLGLVFLAFIAAVTLVLLA